MMIMKMLILVATCNLSEWEDTDFAEGHKSFSKKRCGGSFFADSLRECRSLFSL